MVVAAAAAVAAPAGAAASQMNLEFNNSGEGVHALAEALQNNKTLTNLNLTANQVRLADSTQGGSLVESVRVMVREQQTI